MKDEVKEGYLKLLISSFKLYFLILDDELDSVRITQHFHYGFRKITLITSVLMIRHAYDKLLLIFFPPRHIMIKHLQT
jgi:hypothetical protein